MENTAALCDLGYNLLTSVEEKSLSVWNSEQEVKPSLWAGCLLEYFIYSVFQVKIRCFPCFQVTSLD